MRPRPFSRRRLRNDRRESGRADFSTGLDRRIAADRIRAVRVVPSPAAFLQLRERIYVTSETSAYSPSACPRLDRLQRLACRLRVVDACESGEQCLPLPFRLPGGPRFSPSGRFTCPYSSAASSASSLPSSAEGIQLSSCQYSVPAGVRLELHSVALAAWSSDRIACQHPPAMQRSDRAHPRSDHGECKVGLQPGVPYAAS